VEKIKPEMYPQIGVSVFQVIKKICGTLPCPDCSTHASFFLSRVRPANLKSKETLRFYLYSFHNAVNKRKRKDMFPFEALGRYQNMSLIQAFNQFVSVYRTRNNMKLLADNFQRQMILKDVKQWLIRNSAYFDA
jgi:hypothetical protein